MILSLPFFFSLTHLVCHTCFKRHEKLHRCGQCKFAHYCDRTCQKDAWVNHKSECSAIKKHGKAPNENIRLAARIMWRIDREGGGLTEGCFVSIDSLQNHVEHFGEEEKKELRIDLESFLEFWPSESKQFGMQYISHILGVQINCNGFTLSDQRGLQAVGVGIFPNLCLVNHDCWPNCTVIFNNGNHEAVRSLFHTQMRIELRALGKISVGEELTVSYIDFLNVTEDRRQQLKKQYYFDCTCEHCQKGIKDDLKLAAKEGEEKPSQDVVKDIIQLSKDTLEKIDKARSEGSYHEVVKLKLYHPNNAQLGMALMRAGVTHWHAGLIEAGHGMICKAYAILLVTHGPTHPITKDLEAMRIQSEMELRMFQQNEFMYYKMREAALQNQQIQILPEPTNEISPGIFQKKQ
ncbi:hypothetical protein JD844_002426 [Phrynosoma platyrhinos]|uniref:[histone H3]-lysine(4) N-trimethyltransferase n=1 Tax=Phrynosoma platyrhinos TaxID=52577 RepID=A0ABQ7TC44_PHRPL|nr:hypothetical protein JD844_002426 [Phrynosoma platyrhinos]